MGNKESLTYLLKRWYWLVVNVISFSMWFFFFFLNENASGFLIITWKTENSVKLNYLQVQLAKNNNVKIWICFLFGFLKNKLLKTTVDGDTWLYFSWLLELSHRCMFNFFRNFQTIFQYSCNILHSHQLYIKLAASHTHQHLKRSLINFSHCNRILEIPHCDFNLHFPNQ